MNRPSRLRSHLAALMLVCGLLLALLGMPATTPRVWASDAATPTPTLTPTPLPNGHCQDGHCGGS